jgi:hypothetical protein
MLADATSGHDGVSTIKRLEKMKTELLHRAWQPKSPDFGLALAAIRRPAADYITAPPGECTTNPGSSRIGAGSPLRRPDQLA